jgi:hypothetical protein
MLLFPPDYPLFLGHQSCVCFVDLGAMTAAGEIPTVLSDEFAAPELLSLAGPASMATEIYCFVKFLFALFCGSRLPEDPRRIADLQFPEGLQELRHLADLAISAQPERRPTCRSFMAVLQRLLGLVLGYQ